MAFATVVVLNHLRQLSVDDRTDFEVKSMYL